MNDQVDKAISEMGDEYRLIFQKMASGCALHQMVLDDQGKPIDYIFLDINPAFEKITGLSKEVILGKRVTKVLPGIELDPVNWIGRYGQVAETETPTEFENYSQNLNKWFNVSAYSPKKGYFISIIDDITEKKLMAEKAIEASKVLEDIINAIPARVFWKDKDLRYLGCNKIFAEDAGFSNPSELIGKDDYEMSWRDQAELYRSADAEVIKSNTAKLNIEEPQTDTKGKNITLLTSKMPLTNRQGEVMGVIGVYMDVTDHKQAEESAKREKNLMQALMDSIPGAFYALDEKGQYVRWNAYQRDEIIGKSDSEIPNVNAVDTIHPDDQKLVQARIENVLKNGAKELVEGRVLLRGGPDFRWLLMSGQQMMYEGKPWLVGIGLDITERKKFEKEYEESKTSLENKVKELETFTKLTVNRELKMIELKNKLKDQSK